MSLILLFLDTSGGPPPPPVILVDTHDGGRERHKRKKLDDDYRARQESRLEGLKEAWDLLVEGKSPVVEALAEEFPTEPVVKAKDSPSAPPMPDFARIEADIVARQRIWEAFIEMDDEEVLLLI